MRWKTVRHQPQPAPDTALRVRLRDLANERCRFGDLRLFVLLRREGEPSRIKRIYRLYSEEGLTVRNAKRGARRLAQGPRSWSKPVQTPAGHWISSTASLPATGASGC